MIYTIAWLIWGAAFFAIEIPALIWGRTANTLSGHVWNWFHVRDRRPTAITWALRGVLLAVLVWLVGHLGFGLWTL